MWRRLLGPAHNERTLSLVPVRIIHVNLVSCTSDPAASKWEGVESKNHSRNNLLIYQERRLLLRLFIRHQCYPASLVGSGGFSYQKVSARNWRSSAMCDQRRRGPCPFLPTISIFFNIAGGFVVDLFSILDSSRYIRISTWTSRFLGGTVCPCGAGWIRTKRDFQKPLKEANLL